MKFNKSTESDFYYVGFNDDIAAGKIITFSGKFYPCDYRSFHAYELIEIANFIDKLNLESCIDTASTFTSNSVQS